MAEKAGNDFDQASLLIALLRTSGIPARYVYGTVELPIEKVMNWLGGFTDTNSALNLIATAGIPVSSQQSAGTIVTARIEHVWIEAHVPYGNYRGIIRDDSIKTCIPLDPSYKHYQYKRGMDFYSAMGINGEQYIQDYIADTSTYPIPAEFQLSIPDYLTSSYEAAGHAVVVGASARQLHERPDGTLDVAEVDDAFRNAADPHGPIRGLVAIENTHAHSGGQPLTAEHTRAIADLAHEHGVPLHVDGARFFNAAVALGIPARELAAPADSVTFCLSKGLACPVGSMVVGGREFIWRARRARKLLGGGMRQAGILAAAGLVALDSLVPRLADDHANAIEVSPPPMTTTRLPTCCRRPSLKARRNATAVTQFALQRQEPATDGQPVRPSP